MVGYNVQAAVDTRHHVVVATKVTNRGHDRSHLLEMAKAAQAEIGAVEMIAFADRGYYEGRADPRLRRSGHRPDRAQAEYVTSSGPWLLA